MGGVVVATVATDVHNGYISVGTTGSAASLAALLTSVTTGALSSTGLGVLVNRKGLFSNYEPLAEARWNAAGYWQWVSRGYYKFWVEHPPQVAVDVF
jgi:hypothetical protein